METNDDKLFHCSAPNADEKQRWIDLMATLNTPRTDDEEPVLSHSSGERVAPSSHGKHVQFEEDRSETRSDRLFADPNEIPDAVDDVFGTDSSDGHADSSDEFQEEGQDLLAGTQPRDDRELELFRDSHEDSLSFPDPDDQRRKPSNDDALTSEPADWALYGDENDTIHAHHRVSRYDIVDKPVVLLDNDLLDKAQKPPQLATDEFLFEDSGPRFGAVEVTTSRADDDDDANDFVDPRVTEHYERKKREKQLQRVTKKLESNRDLYAEMAAARLNDMRKVARQQPRRSIGQRRDDWSDLGDDESEVAAAHYEDQAHESRPSSVDRSEVSVANEEDDLPFEEIAPTADVEADLREYEAVRLEDTSSPLELGDDLLFGEASVAVATAVDEAEVDAPEESSKSKKDKKRVKKERAQRDDTEIVDPTLDTEVVVPAEAVAEDDEEIRRREKERRRAERRARKEKQRKEEEEAAAAEELARQHREAMREREEEKLKQERKERKERKKLKEKSALEKKAKELKQREAELLAEAEKLRQTQEAIKQEDEKKDRKKKRRDKYTPPTERIHRREQEEVAMASDLSTALVVVEPKSAEDQTVDNASFPQPTQSSPSVETPAVTEAAHVPVQAQPEPMSNPAVPAPPLSAPTPLGSTIPVAAAQPAVSPDSVSQPPQSTPAAFPVMQPAAVPAFYPAYAGGVYQVPATYPASYPAVHYTPGFATVPYGPGIAVPSPYHPHLGYVSGIAPAVTGLAVGGAFQTPPPSSTEETTEAFIGPQLPPGGEFSLPGSPIKSVTVASAPDESTVKTVSTSAASALPELPDIDEF
ncbi:hypothetical protein PINS_up011240 [Pythium insidiosum]|nr:hypothetical protein PINS_up011240 [Pythium insidiosum]